MAAAPKATTTKRSTRPILRTGKARQRLALQHARLATIYAKRYAGRGLSFDDLVQEAWEGILHAAARFDESRPEKFETYAKFYIHRSVYRALRRGRPTAMRDDPTAAVNALQVRQATEAPRNEEAAELVREGLCLLSFNEARMLRLRHGIGFPAMTSAEAAKALGVRTSSGDRIYARAKAKLKTVIEGRERP